MFSSILTIILLLITNVFGLTSTVYTKQQCRTTYTSKSVLASTTTRAYTITFTPRVVVTATPTITRTPPPVTTTITTTSTSSITLPVVTDTFTATSTSTTTFSSTTQIIVTTTETTTSTTTLTAYTSTIAAPARFTYINDPKPAVKMLRNVKGTRHTIEERETNCNKARCNSPAKYVAGVQCSKVVISVNPTTSTRTATSTAVVTGPPETSTATLTATSTSTITQANAKTTITETATASTTTTISTTSTSTTTIVATATYTPPDADPVYEACINSRNIRQNQRIDFDITPSSPVTAVLLDTANAYDCCAACFQTANCGSSDYASDAPAGQACELVTNTDKTCPAYQARHVAIVYPFNGNGLTVSNGPCGQDDIGT